MRAAALFVLTLAVYWPTIRSAGFIWDDDQHVLNNRALRDVHAMKKIWLEIGATQQYYPLVYSSFLIERKFFQRLAARHLGDLAVAAARSAPVARRVAGGGDLRNPSSDG